MYDSHNIATTIKDVAKSRNIVIKNMLASLGLGSNAMSAMYHGKSISSDSLALIADYLGVSVDYLLGRSDDVGTSAAGDVNAAELLNIYNKLSAVDQS